MKSTDRTPHQQGHDGYWGSLKNPFEPGTQDHDQWDRGWAEAKNEHNQQIAED